jgi:hypothetical protein
MRVSDLTREKAVRAVVDLGDGDTIDLKFDRNKVTPAWVTLALQRDEAEDTLSLPKALADVILSWDVTNDDGTDFAPTADNIAVFSFPVQRHLLKKIMESAVPSSEEGNVSSELPVTPSSDSTVPEPTSRNGAVTEPSPVVSGSLSPT